MNDNKPTGGFNPEELISLARQKNAEGRSLLAKTLTDLFSGEGQVLTERERMLMFNILHSVFKDIELSVRKIIGEELSVRADVPRDLVSDLANDDIEVAYPILSKSSLLHDEQLIEVIRNRTLEHQLAIAVRHDVSEALSDELVKTGHKSVIKTLLENQNAQISRATMDYLVEESQRVDDFQEPILRREDLPEDLATKMLAWVSAALRKHIITRYQLDSATVDDLLEQAANATAKTKTDKKVERLADTLGAGGKVDSDILISALNDGEVRLFISLLSRYSNVPEKLIARMLFETGGEGLAITCKGIGLTLADFSTIFAMSRKARPTGLVNFHQQHQAAREFYSKLTDEAASEVIKQWRRNPDYLAAIRKLDIDSL